MALLSMVIHPCLLVVFFLFEFGHKISVVANSQHTFDKSPRDSVVAVRCNECHSEQDGSSGREQLLLSISSTSTL